MLVNPLLLIQTKTMTQQQLKEWQVLVKQYNNGYHLSAPDKQELLRLNHLVMELSNKIHNDHMINPLLII